MLGKSDRKPKHKRWKRSKGEVELRTVKDALVETFGRRIPGSRHSMTNSTRKPGNAALKTFKHVKRLMKAFGGK